MSQNHYEVNTTTTNISGNIFDPFRAVVVWLRARFLEGRQDVHQSGRASESLLFREKNKASKA